jgi:hypothetical protein
MAVSELSALKQSQKIQQQQQQEKKPRMTLKEVE